MNFFAANILAPRSTDHNWNPGWRLVLTFFHSIPQEVLLQINFVFRRGTFSAVVVQTSWSVDWYFGFLLNWRKPILETFNLATKPARSHRVLTAVFGAGLGVQLSLTFSCTLLFSFVLFWKFCLRFNCEKYHNFSYSDSQC